MAIYNRCCFIRSFLISSSSFSTTCSTSNKWRRQQGLEPEPRQFSPLTNLPDYSFVDGRPAILSGTKLSKLKYQQEICKRIVDLTNEIDVGLQQYHEKQEQLRQEREAILKNKLKPKGAALLSKRKVKSDLKS